MVYLSVSFSTNPFSFLCLSFSFLPTCLKTLPYTSPATFSFAKAAYSRPPLSCLPTHPSPSQAPYPFRRCSRWPNLNKTSASVHVAATNERNRIYGVSLQRNVATQSRLGVLLTCRIRLLVIAVAHSGLVAWADFRTFEFYCLMLLLLLRSFSILKSVSFYFVMF